ncbi:MAG TPA: hypothetical protein VFJ82_08915 [Longimicrobium sp.]|nr:hypothetical protein [Longimicrobium sp.]
MADTHARSQRRRAERKAAASPPPARPSGPGLFDRLTTAAPWKLALAFALLHAVLAVMAFNPTPYVGGDNATYMALAQALAEKHRYIELWDPAMRPHTQYPPLWPAFLAVLWTLGLRGWMVMKVVVLLCSAAAVALSYLWLRRTSTPGIAFGAALVLAFAPGVLDLSHWELSDQPAWVLTMLAFWASTHLAGAPERERDVVDRRHGLWLGVFVAGVVLGNFVRAAGLPLVVAAAAWLVLRRQRRNLAVLAAAFLPPAFLWWLWGHVNGAPGYTSFLLYVDPYVPALGKVGVGGMLERLLTNAGRYTGMHMNVVFFWSDAFKSMVTVPLALLAVAGWVRRLKKPGLVEVWVPLYVALLLVWPPTWSGERFLLPLAPVLLCYAGEALRDAAAVPGVPALARVVPATAAALLLILAIPGTERVVAVGHECTAMMAAGETIPCMNDEYHDFLKLAEITRGKLPPGSVALSRKATFWYALSGYQSRTYPLSADPDTFFAFARRSGAQYVVFDNIRDLAPRYLHPVLAARQKDFCVVDPGLHLPNATLLRIDPGPPPPPGTPDNVFRLCRPVPQWGAPPPR